MLRSLRCERNPLDGVMERGFGGDNAARYGLCVRIPIYPATYSDFNPATCSDPFPATHSELMSAAV